MRVGWGCVWGDVSGMGLEREGVVLDLGWFGEVLCGGQWEREVVQLWAVRVGVLSVAGVGVGLVAAVAGCL